MISEIAPANTPLTPLVILTVQQPDVPSSRLMLFTVFSAPGLFRQAFFFRRSAAVLERLTVSLPKSAFALCRLVPLGSAPSKSSAADRQEKRGNAASNPFNASCRTVSSIADSRRGGTSLCRPSSTPTPHAHRQRHHDVVAGSDGDLPRRRPLPPPPPPALLAPAPPVVHCDGRVSEQLTEPPRTGSDSLLTAPVVSEWCAGTQEQGGTGYAAEHLSRGSRA